MADYLIASGGHSTKSHEHIWWWKSESLGYTICVDKAIGARTDALRKRVQDTMTELGIQKIACPLFEVRIQKNPPAVEVFDEQMIPSMFWRTPDPVLDKALLKEHMKAGEEIPGARLIQGESLRVK